MNATTTPTDPVQRAHAERDWARAIALKALGIAEKLLAAPDDPETLMRARVGVAPLRVRLHGPDHNLDRGTIVQVIKPAADGSKAVVGMIGFVETEGEAPSVPDAGGVHVHFQWHDAALSGSIALDRLRVVGATDFLPVGPAEDHPAGVITVADAGELRTALREVYRLADRAVDLGWSIKNNPSDGDFDERQLVHIRGELTKYDSLARTEHDTTITQELAR
jgi:hypothetical protein